MYLCIMDDFKNTKGMPNIDIIMVLGKRFNGYRIAHQLVQLEVSEKPG